MSHEISENERGEMSLANDHYVEAIIAVDDDDNNEPWLTFGPEGTGPWSQATTGMRLADVRRLIDAWDRKHSTLTPASASTFVDLFTALKANGCTDDEALTEVLRLIGGVR